MMSREAKFVKEAFADALIPDPLLDVADWVCENVYLPAGESAQPGLYDIDNTPYMRGIYDELSPTSLNHTITVMKGAQLGFSTAALAWILYCMAHRPANILFINPTLDMTKTASQSKLQPMIDSCADLNGKVAEMKQKDAANSVYMKQFKGGTLRLAGANSASSLRSSAIKYLILDELSAYERDINGEGDPIKLAKQRTVTHRRSRKILQISTPILKGLDATEEEFFKSDQRYFFVPCPHCGESSPIIFQDEPFEGDVKWKRIGWDKDSEGNHLPRTAHIICDACGCKIEEHQKMWMLDEANGAEWVATAEGEDGHVGFHLNSLYSPWYTWAEMVSEFLEANQKAKKGDTTALQTFVNLKLGETWQSSTSEVEPSRIYYRREVYDHDVPHNATLLTVGADLQKDRIEATVYAWGDGDEGWAIDHLVFPGDPNDINSTCYEGLGNLIDHTTYTHESGVKLPIAYAGIDEGGGSWNQALYQFTRKRQSRGVLAVKGASGREKGLVWEGSADKRTGARHLQVGTKTAKKRLFDMLNVEEQGRGYIHYPQAEAFEKDFFDQLGAEIIVEKYVKGYKQYMFKKVQERNEALDCLVYAYVIYKFYNPNILAVRMRYGLDAYLEDREDQQEEKPADREQVIASKSKQQIYQPPKKINRNFQGGRYKRGGW